MKDIKNTSRRPIAVPLPRGRKLHLNPLQTGAVAPNVLEHPPFQKLVEAGDIQVLGEGDHSLPNPLKKQQATTGGADHSSVPIKPSGER